MNFEWKKFGLPRQIIISGIESEFYVRTSVNWAVVDLEKAFDSDDDDDFIIDSLVFQKNK